jgi:hypothetical protein
VHTVNLDIFEDAIEDVWNEQRMMHLDKYLLMGTSTRDGGRVISVL